MMHLLHHREISNSPFTLAVGHSMVCSELKRTEPG